MLAKDLRGRGEDTCNCLVLSVGHTLAWCMDNLLFYGPGFPRSDLILIEKGIQVISLAKLRQGCQNLEKEGGKGSLRDSVVKSCNKICTLEKGEIRKESICLLTKLTCSLVTLGLSPRRVLTGPSVRLYGGTSTGGKK